MWTTRYDEWYPGEGMGVEFLGLGDSSRAKLEKLLAELAV